MQLSNNMLLRSVAVLLAAVLASTSNAEFVNYYVALDTGETEAVWSAYRDQDGDGEAEKELANPNKGRLTFLYAHPNEEDPTANHFHTVGRYAHTGPLDAPVITDKNEYNFWSGETLIKSLPGNQIPEQFAELGETVPPLALLPSDGLYAGKLTSLVGGEQGGTYANMEIRPATDLASYAEGTPEHIMLHALEPYGEQYDAPLNGAVVAMELIDLTPGLNIGDLAQHTIVSNAGDTAPVGLGDDNFTFTPVFWTEPDAAPGVYSATMRLLDQRPGGGGHLPSGQYTFSFAVVPEPSTGLLTTMVLFAVGAVRIRRRR